MSEEGIQDFVGVINVTLEGIKIAGALGKNIGSIGVSCTRGTIKLVANIAKMFTWIARTIHDAPYYKTGGKISNKVLATKFQDLNFSEVRLYYAQSIYTNLNKEYPGTYDQAKIDKLLNPDILKKEFDTLAKKNGLVYSKVPNFIVDRESGLEEFRFAYSKSQETAMLETKAQMQALIYKKLKKCGVPDNAAKEYSEKMIKKDDGGKPLTSALDEIGITKATDEQFDLAMQETFPKYDPKEFVPVEPSEEKKKDFIEITDKNEYTQQKARGNAKEITFSQILKRDSQNQSITVVLDQYPNVAITIKQSDILDIQRKNTDRGITQHRVTLRKDTKFKFEVYYANPFTKKVDATKNPKHYNMTLNEFELLMKQNAEKSKQKMAKYQLPAPTQINKPKPKISRR